MSASSPIIQPLRKIRVCDEHRCSILRKQNIWQQHRNKALPSYLRFHTETTTKNPPTPDYRGRLRTAYQNLFLFDDRFNEKQERHQVLLAHCFRLDDGEIGASGLFDPKELIVGDVLYARMKPTEARCELCEAGDPIPPHRRFFREGSNASVKPAIASIRAGHTLGLSQI